MINFYFVVFLMEGIVKCIFLVCDNIFLILIGFKIVYIILDVEEVIVVMNVEDVNWRESKEVKKIVDFFMEGFERIFFK